MNYLKRKMLGYVFRCEGGEGGDGAGDAEAEAEAEAVAAVAEAPAPSAAAAPAAVAEVAAPAVATGGIIGGQMAAAPATDFTDSTGSIGAVSTGSTGIIGGNMQPTPANTDEQDAANLAAFDKGGTVRGPAFSVPTLGQIGQQIGFTPAGTSAAVLGANVATGGLASMYGVGSTIVNALGEIIGDNTNGRGLSYGPTYSGGTINNGTQGPSMNGPALVGNNGVGSGQAIADGGFNNQTGEGGVPVSHGGSSGPGPQGDTPAAGIIGSVTGSPVASTPPTPVANSSVNGNLFGSLSMGGWSRASKRFAARKVRIPA